MAYDPDIRTLGSSVVYSDPWIRLRKDEIERRDGSRGTYAVVIRADFALVIPAENGGFHLVEEFRYPVGRRSWSFPQGGFPHGQTGSPEELAVLELTQETGLRAGKISRLGSLSVAHGMSSQWGHYYLATDLTPGPADRETEEQDMRQAWVTRAEFEEMTRDGRVTDDSTLAAYALLLIAERRGDVELLPAVLEEAGEDAQQILQPLPLQGPSCSDIQAPGPEPKRHVPKLFRVHPDV